MASIISIFLLLGLMLLFIFRKPQIDSNLQKDDKKVIQDIKNEINVTGNTELYQIQEEYDGKQILQIKPKIQFETALAGILKKEQPLENELQDLLQQRPTRNGIWIAKQAREKFLELLRQNEIKNYAIKENGYLYEKEESKQEKEKILNTAIASDKLYIIDISGVSYIRDEISGKIGEYPFEKMDPYLAVDSYHDGKQVIIQITTNEKQKLSNEEILNEILNNL